MTEQVNPGAPMQPMQPAPPEKKGGASKIIFSIIAIVVALVVIGLVKFGLREVIAFFSGDTTKANAGDCITDNKDADKMKVVDCGGTEAKFKVHGVLEDKTQAEGEQGCAKYPEAEEYLFLYEGTLKDSTKGRILCLGPNAK